MLAPRVYVDIDETLVSTRWNVLDSEVVLRESAIPFLEELRAQGIELYALSFDDRQRQIQKLRTVGIQNFFIDVIGRDDDPGSPSCTWVLVDNEDPEFVGLQHKIRQLGKEPTREVLELHFVQCADWLGEEDEEPLTGLIPLVLMHLQRQGEAR